MMADADRTGLSGRVVIVTGAAGGVGRATVRLLVERGASIVAQDLSPAVRELSSGQVEFVVGDVREHAIAARSAQTALDRFGRLDALVNNAAVILSKDILATTEEEWEQVMRINVTGAFHFCRAALPHMIAQNRGSIVNVTSISGLVGLPQQAAYCASKGALVQLTRQLAVEYAAQNVRVNSVAPGAIDTPFLARHLAAQPDPAAAAAAVDAAHPLGRSSSPAEIAEIIAFLVSDASSYMTGAIVAADAGYTAR
jgi:NAD(P)-dependent dehydrogenase (short-subunit alcohol dehydrogenase family)